MESRSAGLFLTLILLAAALRLPDLARRPMHADEAIHADKLGTLLEGKGYAYDPSEYHGPTLYYLTLVPARLRGERRYADLDEVTLRCVPAVLGVALVAAHLGARTFLGLPAAMVAALLTALSPAMVFYSRYYIHEMPLVFFTFGALLGTGWYVQRRSALAALFTGTCAGLMLATKETAPLALGSILMAFVLTGLVEWWQGRSVTFLGSAVARRDLFLAGLATLGVSSVFFSSFLVHPRGIADSMRAYGAYLQRAHTASVHVHPWHYYLGLLAHFPARGTPFWTEGLILALAVVGGLSAWVGKGPRGGDARALRFLSLYTLLVLVAYSAIPYKTPWCLLSVLHGMILLAGAGVVVLVGALRSAATKTVVAVLLSVATAHLGFQAFSGSFRFEADPRNPYVYAQTGTDVFKIESRLEELARVDPRGSSLPVQVISRENLWPLPWYLRRFRNVGWWSGVPDERKVAPVVLLTPDMEAALATTLYDLPPPGARALYVSLFDRRVELRPGVEVRGYVASSLSEKVRELERSRPGTADRDSGK